MGNRLSPLPAARAKRATLAEILGTSDFNFKGEAYKALSSAIDADLIELGKSLSKVKTSLTSRREAALLNQREQDFQSLQQGGLCKALGERYCIYGDKTGMVEESMAELGRRLEDWKREMERKISGSQSSTIIIIVSVVAGYFALVMLAVFNSLVDSSRARSPPPAQ